MISALLRDNEQITGENTSTCLSLMPTLSGRTGTFSSFRPGFSPRQGLLCGVSPTFCFRNLLHYRTFYRFVPIASSKLQKVRCQILNIGAGLLSLLVSLICLAMALTILATVPLAVIQNSLSSIVAKNIIQGVPLRQTLSNNSEFDKFNRIKGRDFS